MNTLKSCLLINFLFTICSSLRILIIVPGLSNSHVLFNYRLAETLTKGGHNVSLLNLVLAFNEILPANPPMGVSEIRFEANLPADLAEEYVSGFQGSVFQTQGAIQRLVILKSFYGIIVNICQQFVNEEKLMSELQNQTFDITLSHFFTLCPAGISHKLNVSKFVWVASGTYITDFAASTLGMSSLASYVPQYSAPLSDKMTFIERISNFLRQFISNLIVSTLMTSANLENKIFQRFPEVNFPDLMTLVQKTQALLINGESFLDFPRPILSNVLYMGDMEHKQAKKLKEEWQLIMDGDHHGVILFSLGTVANSSLMPMELKVGFLKAFSQFSNYLVIWRLEGQMPEGLEEQKHIKIVKWIPQRDLLQHPKLKVFITHGGYNSLLETAQSGVPMILLPLFGDQYGNAYRAMRHGLGLVLDKFNYDSEYIAETIRTVLTDNRFQLNCLKFSTFLNEKIIPNEKGTLHMIEKVVKSRKWSISSSSERLNVFQYFCLDIVAFYSCLLFCVLFLVLMIVRKFKKVLIKRRQSN